MFYLYKISNKLSGKVYIGQSNKEKERWRQHKYFAKNPWRTGQYIHRAMNKYGIENFEYEIVAMTRTVDGANEAETQLINQHNSRNPEFGYNLAPGGSDAWNRGLPKEQQPMYGKKQSEYQKKRCSESHLGWKNPHSKEWSAKLSKVMSGRVLTEEWKNKISSVQRMFSEEIEKQIALDRIEGMKLKELSLKYGCSITAIGRIIKRQI